jgi:hypothetical protein
MSGMLVTDADKQNRRNSYSLSDYSIWTLKKILGNIKRVTKEVGPGPKILEPTGSNLHTL